VTWQLAASALALLLSTPQLAHPICMYFTFPNFWCSSSVQVTTAEVTLVLSGERYGESFTSSGRSPKHLSMSAAIWSLVVVLRKL